MVGMLGLVKYGKEEWRGEREIWFVQLWADFSRLSQNRHKVLSERERKRDEGEGNVKKREGERHSIHGWYIVVKEK